MPCARPHSWFVLVSWLAFASACTLSERDLHAFRSTATGPEKIRAVLRDSSSRAPLRAQAALTLLDLDRTDVDGRALLFAELRELDRQGRAAIVPTFQQGLSARMRTARGAPPSAQAARAKDAGIALLPLLEARERALLGAELLSWVADDVVRRGDLGEHRLEALAEGVGEASAGTLVESLREDVEGAVVLRLARIIDRQSRDASVRSRAALRIADIEQAYRTSQHDAVLEQQAKRALGGAHKASAEVLKAQVSALRRATLTSELLPALGLFADQAPARARLLELARSSAAEHDERHLALQLLEGHTTSAELASLLELALDASELEDLRATALSRAGELRTRDALPALLSLLPDREHHSLRQRAGELTLDIGGPDALAAFFRGLPRHWDTALPKREIDAYSERIQRFLPTQSLLLLLGERLHSVMWWGRVLALRYFAARGTLEDAWRIRQHLRDAHLVLGEGWPRGHTVGLEAEAALAVVLERNHGGKAQVPVP